MNTAERLTAKITAGLMLVALLAAGNQPAAPQQARLPKHKTEAGYLKQIGCQPQGCGIGHYHSMTDADRMFGIVYDPIEGQP